MTGSTDRANSPPQVQLQASPAPAQWHGIDANLTATALVAAGQQGPSLVVRHSYHHLRRGSLRTCGGQLSGNPEQRFQIYAHTGICKPQAGGRLSAGARRSVVALSVWAWTSNPTRLTSTHFFDSTPVGDDPALAAALAASDGRVTPHASAQQGKFLCLLAGAIQARRAPIGTLRLGTFGWRAGPQGRVATLEY